MKTASPTRLLILGGTAEARELAARCRDELPGLQVTSSLAGRTRAPLLPAGALRSGGFGGAEGLRRYLREYRIDRLIDATHPFAAAISAAAVAACEAAAVPRLVLRRSPWLPQPNDRWLPVADMTAAAAALAAPGLGRRVLVASGSRGLSALADRNLLGHYFLIRLIEPQTLPDALAGAEILLARGPFAAAEERRLLQRRRISVVLAKNSGGAAGYGKIAAARALGLPVVLLQPPPPPPGRHVEDLDAALNWLDDAAP